MKTYGVTSVSEFLGDFIVYRNLVPQDARLPSLASLRATLGLSPDVTPRKSEPDYARVIVGLLRCARELSAPGVPLRRLIYVGDTRMNDGAAFINIGLAGGWPGLAFIGAERDDPAQVEIMERGEHALYLSNRWAGLRTFADFCATRGFKVDSGTAVVFDLDKTTLGARGRNDHVINSVRVSAVRRTVETLLDTTFSAETFGVAYDTFNRPVFHAFTADNQDYLAYICLIIGSGTVALSAVVDRVQTGDLTTFAQFIAEIDTISNALPANLRVIHRDIFDHVLAGDPTPFKAFRRNEYLTTIARMGHLDTDVPEALLADEIVITQEVRRQALAWRAQGALLFGLSDKPDEASLPAPEQAAQGYLPLHRVPTHAVGSG
ncbi:MAG: hypothetical protein JXB35_11310 [Anaerolineae bacterium]|nr:hypothetical protein [Anaerolineae bacterium]